MRYWAMRAKKEGWEEAGLSILTEGQKVEYEVVSKPDGKTAAGNLKLAD
jgi:cold shock CspA family protein